VILITVLQPLLGIIELVLCMCVLQSHFSSVKATIGTAPEVVTLLS